MSADLPSAAFLLGDMKNVFGEPRLTVELIPKSTWGSNLKRLLKRSEWDKIRKITYAAAAHRCEICGGVGKHYAVACHEGWIFEEKYSLQTLVGLVALCPACHEVKHLGRAELIGRGFEARAHLAKINGWSEQEANAYLSVVAAVWKIRSNRRWYLDVSWLKQFGIKPARLRVEPPSYFSGAA